MRPVKATIEATIKEYAMRSANTIQREIAALERMSKNAKLPVHTQCEAYEAYHALRWVINDLDERPSRLILAAAR
jgi:uncharacterized protein (UPF0147 family)